jgi:hypothetical protein
MATGDKTQEIKSKAQCSGGKKLRNKNELRRETFTKGKENAVFPSFFPKAD